MELLPCNKTYMKLQYLSLAFIFLALFTPGYSLNGDSLKVKLHKAKFYIGWGYNRDWYSKGNVRLRNNNPQLINGTYYTYDFTVVNAKAHDRAQFDQIYDVKNITIPQFSVRLGAFFNNKSDLGFELNYDHAKYVVDDYQKVRVKGQVNGNYFDKDTVLDPNTFLHYEHTDGANFFMFALVKRWKLLRSENQKNSLGIIVKPGAGFVYPRTAVTLFGNSINNNWKISGYMAGIETGLRAEVLNRIYLEFTGKAGYANYVNALVQGKGYGKASNSFWFFEAILILGYQFKI